LLTTLNESQPRDPSESVKHCGGKLSCAAVDNIHF